MVEWLMDNIEWLFSGVGVVIITFVIGKIWKKNSKAKKNKLHKSQIHSGKGDNVMGDKIINND